jgi:carboxyl-terminal processing protease
MASAERDTVGRPTCKTAAGRTVFGGGGIYPDVRTPTPAEPPAWLAKVNELELTLAWVGGFVEAHGNALGALEAFGKAPALPAAAAASFRALAKERGAVIPESPEDVKVLDRLLLQAVAYAKWGTRGLYQVEARLDPAVAEAMRHFPSPR